MTRKKLDDSENSQETSQCGCTRCMVEAVLSIDDRGQMVLPKDIREKAGIRTGDKLALISWEKDGNICCLVLMKVENLSGMVQEVLGPLIQERS